MWPCGIPCVQKVQKQAVDEEVRLVVYLKIDSKLDRNFKVLPNHLSVKSSYVVHNTNNTKRDVVIIE